MRIGYYNTIVDTADYLTFSLVLARESGLVDTNSRVHDSQARPPIYTILDLIFFNFNS